MWGVALPPRQSLILYRVVNGFTTMHCALMGLSTIKTDLVAKVIQTKDVCCMVVPGGDGGS